MPLNRIPMDMVEGLTSNLADNTTRIKNKSYDLMKDYGAKGDGTTDDTQAILNAVNDSFNNGYVIYVPKGSYRFTSTIEIKGVFIGHDNEDSSEFIKDFNGDGIHIYQPATVFKHITVLCSTNARSTDTGSGIVIGDGGTTNVASRVIVKANSHYHGKNGIWIMSGNDIIVEGYYNFNKSDGLLIDDNSGAIDTNTGKYYVFCTGNGGHGLNLNHGSVNDIFAVCQGNSGFGVNLNYVNNRLFLYTEGNTQGSMNITSSGFGNHIQGKFVDGLPTIGNSGNIIIENTNTSNTFYMMGLNLKSTWVANFAWTGTSIPANSSIDFNTANNIYGLTSTSTIIATPETILPSGIVMNAYYSASNTVGIRLANITTGSISVPSTTFRVTALNT